MLEFFRCDCFLFAIDPDIHLAGLGRGDPVGCDFAVIPLDSDGEPASRAQVKADELNERYQAAARMTARLRDQVRSLQTQVDEARQRQDHLGLRESGAESLEKLHRLQREQRQDTRTLQDDLTSRRDTVARREDRLAARDELKP